MKTFESPYQPVYDIPYREKLLMEVEFDFGADPAFIVLFACLDIYKDQRTRPKNKYQRTMTKGLGPKDKDQRIRTKGPVPKFIDNNNKV